MRENLGGKKSKHKKSLRQAKMLPCYCDIRAGLELGAGFQACVRQPWAGQPRCHVAVSSHHTGIDSNGTSTSEWLGRGTSEMSPLVQMWSFLKTRIAHHAQHGSGMGGNKGLPCQPFPLSLLENLPIRVGTEQQTVQRSDWHTP